MLIVTQSVEGHRSIIVGLDVKRIRIGEWSFRSNSKEASLAIGRGLIGLHVVDVNIVDDILGHANAIVPDTQMRIKSVGELHIELPIGNTGSNVGICCVSTNLLQDCLDGIRILTCKHLKRFRVDHHATFSFLLNSRSNYGF